MHHRRSIRLQGYNYSQAGLYFITMCCQDRLCLFGQVVDGKMILNDVGKMADQCWREIPNHFPNAVLHEYIVMPNHVHCIIELVPDVVIGNVGAKNILPRLENGPGVRDVGAENFLPLPFEPRDPCQSGNDPGVRAKNVLPQPATKRNEFQKMIPRSIGSIVKGYKIGVTKWFRNNGTSTNSGLWSKDVRVWQRNYYEHIIRNEESYGVISNYIINNPDKWKEDKLYSE